MINKSSQQSYPFANARVTNQLPSSVETIEQSAKLLGSTFDKCYKTFETISEMEKTSRKRMITPEPQSLKARPIKASAYLGYTSVSDLDKWTRM